MWGEHHSELAAAFGKEHALAYELAQTKLLLAQVVTAQYMQLQTLYAQQNILRQRLVIKKQQENLVRDRDRVRAGVETQIAVLIAEDEVLQAQSQLLNLQLQQRVSWVALNVAFGGGFTSEN